ncbi:sensor domain-containing diguanylate cyclase [Deinococcus sp. Marseille-Q6407]|uniref:GGDEF domain-containing protein n=1 Tax=Deinococcus sp. Marseille-Q6407 TaxID=2969223 RepID=UPI0021BE31C0|nr:GGDEF domain-containing protein [Deinococcus sp. Marseille-Q6407]
MPLQIFFSPSRIVQRRRLVLLIAALSLLCHLFALSALHGDRLGTQMTRLGSVMSAAVLLMALPQRPNFRLISVFISLQALAWTAVALLEAAQQGSTLQASSLLSVGILAALMLALLPPGPAVTLVGTLYLVVCTVALLTGVSDPLTLLVLGTLLVAMTLNSEHGERVTRERARSEMLQGLALHDGLTDLLNRAAAEERLESWLKHPGSSGGYLVLLDLDHFKQINDQHGHLTGDQAPRYTADVLRSHTGAGSLVGRWGGEEFILLLEGHSASEAQAVVEGIQQDLRRSADSGLPPLTVSGGSVSLAEVGAPDLSALLGLADRRLYCAKAAGRDRLIWPGPLAD